MSTDGPTARYTVAEYLHLEAAAKEKHEFRDGRIVAMSGGTAAHSLIIANVIREIGNRLESKPCQIYDSNLRIRTPQTMLYTYPDASVICGPPQFDPEDSNQTTAINPRLLVEVISKSSEAYDRGDKLSRYMTLESLQEYVLVSQNRPRVEVLARLSDGAWRLTFAAGLESSIKLTSIELDASLAEIYRGVQFPPEKEESGAF